MQCVSTMRMRGWTASRNQPSFRSTRITRRIARSGICFRATSPDKGPARSLTCSAASSRPSCQYRTDVRSERDAGVDLSLVELCEVMEAAPVVADVRPVVDGVRRVHAEGEEAIAVEVKRELDRDG